MNRAMPLPRHLLAKTRSFSGVSLFTPNSPCQFRGWSTLTKNRRFPRRLVSPRGNRGTRVINSSGSILAQLRNNGVDTGSTRCAYMCWPKQRISLGSEDCRSYQHLFLVCQHSLQCLVCKNSKLWLQYSGSDQDPYCRKPEALIFQ